MKNNLNPVATYENPVIQKDQINFENKGKAGIYRATNTLNGKSVGSSIHLGERFQQYFSINYLERNQSLAICRALLKHGYSNFMAGSASHLRSLNTVNQRNVLKGKIITCNY